VLEVLGLNTAHERVFSKLPSFDDFKNKGAFSGYNLIIKDTPFKRLLH